MLPLFRADTPHACTCGKTGFEYLYSIIFNRETEHELWDLWSLGSGGPGFSWYIISLRLFLRGSFLLEPGGLDASVLERALARVQNDTLDVQYERLGGQQGMLLPLSQLQVSQ